MSPPPRDSEKRPDDVVPALLWIRTDHEHGFFTEAFRNPEAHETPCRVYWGSHGCSRPAGHEGGHWCDCCECEDHERDHKAEGCVAGPPYYGPSTRFYGEDAGEDALSDPPR